MRYFITMLSLLIFISACDLKKPPVETDADSIYDILPAYNTTSTYPYIEKFKYLLDNSLYQGENQDKLPIDENFHTLYYSEGFKQKTFYLDTDENLVFSLAKQENTHKVSSLLIQNNTWHTNEENGNYISSMARCYKPKNIQAYTWMEVHGEGKKDSNSSIYYNYPLVSLTWERNMKGEYDHIWAVVTKSSPGVNEPKIYEWIDLGARPNNFFLAEIQIRNNIMEIKINYSTISTQNVTYWENVPSYFKVGISLENYLDSGEAGVSFNELRYENNASNVENITHF